MMNLYAYTQNMKRDPEGLFPAVLLGGLAIW